MEEVLGILFTIIILFLLVTIAFLSLTVNENLHKKIEKRFYIKLLELCKKEFIYIKYYDNIYELNEISPYEVKDSGLLAVGKYIYLKKEYDTPLKRLDSKLPEIRLLNDGSVWTLAHELGHHFCAKIGDHTEKQANNYIKNLAKECLNKFERIVLSISLSVYCS